MAGKSINRNRVILILLVLSASAVFLSACNLGPASPSEPTLVAPSTAVPQGDSSAAATATPPIPVVQPTSTPIPDLLPSETLGPITIQGTDHRTQEAITVQVRKGTSVSNVTCSWVHQDTGQTGAMTEVSETTLDTTAVQRIYTYTPQMAGTYSVSCTGVAVTVAGQRAVSNAATPFAVEAKG